MEKYFDENLHNQRGVTLFFDPPKKEEWNAFSFPPAQGESSWSGHIYGTINEEVMRMKLPYDNEEKDT